MQCVKYHCDSQHRAHLSQRHHAQVHQCDVTYNICAYYCVHIHGPRVHIARTRKHNQKLEAYYGDDAFMERLENNFRTFALEREHAIEHIDMAIIHAKK
ncbi:hypothetical protein PUN28_018043 [Cardiocondyla obscurior]|uniref:C2H2-type domain-containing protein n=1 Tax=Cardiocondyla obscurior TaxID=286306 RepID=A0AAW2EFK0_9HYME